MKNKKVWDSQYLKTQNVVSSNGFIMIRVFRIIVLFIVMLALIIIILPKITSKEIYTYDEAARRFAQGKFVTIDGKKVHYIEKGSGEPIILIHGFLYHTIAWKRNLEALGKKFRCYAIDLFGWGYSERLTVNNYSFAFYSKQIVKFMDVLKIERASLIGHSMGGGITVYIAAHYPDRVKKIVLVDPGVLPIRMNIIGRIYQTHYIGEFLNAIPGNALWENNIKTIWYYDPNKVSKDYVSEVVRPLCIKGSHKGLMYILRNILQPPYVENEAQMLSKMNKPILIVHGREDKAVPLDKSELLNKMWKDSKLQVFENCGHNPHEEYPAKFNQLVRDYLSP